jgi:hypothetical protein
MDLLLLLRFLDIEGYQLFDNRQTLFRFLVKLLIDVFCRLVFFAIGKHDFCVKSHSKRVDILGKIVALDSVDQLQVLGQFLPFFFQVTFDLFIVIPVFEIFHIVNSEFDLFVFLHVFETHHHSFGQLELILEIFLTLALFDKSRPFQIFLRDFQPIIRAGVYLIFPDQNFIIKEHF